MNALRPLKSLGWSDHRHIMRWLGVLLCDPACFSSAEDRLPPSSQARVFVMFLPHLLPYAAVLGVAKIAVILSLLAPEAWFDSNLWSAALPSLQVDLLIIFGIAVPVGAACAFRSGVSIALFMTLSFGLLVLFFLDPLLQFTLNDSVILGLGTGAFVGSPDCQHARR